jgi:two-component system sensor histidine kinase/response regulator
MLSTPILVKCLIVDDLEGNRLALSGLLRRDDVEVLTARSGAEALDLLLAHDVALAFLDVQMPEMDGFELAELIRGSERTRHVPLIFVTAGSRDERRMFKGYESGAVDFLYKPIEPHILRNKAEVFFQLYRQRQQLARELRERTETLRLSEMFTAVLGHDLRNPLSAILTSARLLEHEANAPEVRQIGTRVSASARRMSRMIEELVDLARARLAGGIPIDCQDADAGVFVERVIQEQRAAAPDREVALVSEGDLVGCWDAERLAQVVANLVGNAVHHGDPAAPVSVHLDGISPDVLVLTVENAGAIDPDILPFVFDPFRGAPRHRGRSDGLGLGLYIVQQIVRAHGGSIDARSDDGHTRFTVTIPKSSTDRASQSTAPDVSAPRDLQTPDAPLHRA